MLSSKLTVLVSVVDVFIIWPTKLHPARWSRHIFVREKLRKRRGNGKRRWDFPPFSFVLHRGSVAFAFRRLVKASVDHRAGGAGPRTNTTLAVFWSHSRSLRLLRVTPAVCDYWLPAANVLLFSLELCDIPLPVTMHVIKRGKTVDISCTLSIGANLLKKKNTTCSTWMLGFYVAQPKRPLVLVMQRPVS